MSSLEEAGSLDSAWIDKLPLLTRMALQAASRVAGVTADPEGAGLLILAMRCLRDNLI